jgi:hypothetical protein
MFIHDFPTKEPTAVSEDKEITRDDGRALSLAGSKQEGILMNLGESDVVFNMKLQLVDMVRSSW